MKFDTIRNEISGYTFVWGLFAALGLVCALDQVSGQEALPIPDRQEPSADGVQGVPGSPSLADGALFTGEGSLPEGVDPDYVFEQVDGDLIEEDYRAYFYDEYVHPGFSDLNRGFIAMRRSDSRNSGFSVNMMIQVALLRGFGSVVAIPVAAVRVTGVA